MLLVYKTLIFRGILTGPAAFRPRAHTAATYVPSIEKGRPVLQGLLAIDFLAKEASIVCTCFVDKNLSSRNVQLSSQFLIKTELHSMD